MAHPWCTRWCELVKVAAEMHCLPTGFTDSTEILGAFLMDDLPLVYTLV